MCQVPKEYIGRYTYNRGTLVLYVTMYNNDDSNKVAIV